MLTRLLLWSFVLFGSYSILSEANATPPFDRVVAFYYPWFGNPETDGRFVNWNHHVTVRNGQPKRHPRGDDIGADFYPELGCYSSNDPKVLQLHMEQLKQSGVGVLCASWWGKESFTDQALPGLFRAAEDAGLKINFHIEPFHGRSATTTRDAIAYLIEEVRRFACVAPPARTWQSTGILCL